MFSQRWKRMELVDIQNWANDEIYTIEISVMLLHAPYKAEVRKFVPEPGDMMAERWTKDGKTVDYLLPAYGFSNMENTASAIKQMIEREVANYICATVGTCGSLTDTLIWDTYLAAFKRAQTSPVRKYHFLWLHGLRGTQTLVDLYAIANDLKTVREQRLLFDVLRLWVMCRITSNPEHVVGSHRLGVQPIDDPSSPMNGSVPITGVMTAQLECIYYARFLRPFSKNVLENLKNLMQAKEMRYWYTTYLALFILLHSCSMTTRRDMECASTLGFSVSRLLHRNLVGAGPNPITIRRSFVMEKASGNIVLGLRRYWLIIIRR